MEYLPLILAGPILRRVVPNLVTVWITSKGARTVKLSVWKGKRETGIKPTVFHENEDNLDLTGTTNTLRIDDNLHMAVPAAIRKTNPLVSVQVYSYNFALGNSNGNSFVEKEDLNPFL